jgi:hypothetical protein
MSAFIILSLTLSAGSNTNKFTLTVSCMNPILTPASNTLSPKPPLIADGFTHQFNLEQESSFYFEGDGNHKTNGGNTLGYTVTVNSNWNQPVVLNGVSYSLTVQWIITDETHTSAIIQPDNNNQFIIDPIGSACNANATIVIKAIEGSAPANSPALPNGVSFNYTITIAAN